MQTILQAHVVAVAAHFTPARRAAQHQSVLILRQNASDQLAVAEFARGLWMARINWRPTP